MDQVFALMQVCEKYLANVKDVFCAFVNLEKAYDTIDWHGIWALCGRCYECMELQKNC